MSSFYDDASLVMIPSGYKNAKIYCEKPTDGSGDLTFTRASNATRVASNGLIEKVRTNLALYSQNFSQTATWVTSTTTRVDSQTDPNGGTTASKFTATGANSNVIQTLSVSSGVPYTWSFWAKSDSATSVNIRLDNNNGNFAQANMALTTSWQRFSITLNSNATTILCYLGGGLSFTTGEIAYIAFAQLEASDIATDYIATTSAAVSVGPVSGLPRLDYLNSSCPRLLLEPQRTNLVTFSEQLDNAAWSKTQATVTANQAVSPDGYTNADLLVDNSTLSGHVTQQTTISVPSSQAITISGYYKDKDIRYAGFRLFVPTNGTDVGRFSIVVDLQTGAITSTLASGATIANLSYDVTSVGNGWYRLRITGTSPAGNAGIMAWLSPSASPTNDGFATASYVGTGKGCYLYGFQAELGAYATSYINTLSTSVTRVADACSKTGISSLIGQTEGTLFLDANISNLSEARRGIVLYTDLNNYMSLRITSTNLLQFLVVASGSTQASITIANPQGNVKMALAYKANDFAAYLNGTLVGTDTSGSVPATSEFYLGYDPSGSLQIAGGVNQALLFKTRLSNSTLARLTQL
jgi:hypothetical protein